LMVVVAALWLPHHAHAFSTTAVSVALSRCSSKPGVRRFIGLKASKGADQEFNRMYEGVLKKVGEKERAEGGAPVSRAPGLVAKKLSTMVGWVVARFSATAPSVSGVANVPVSAVKRSWTAVRAAAAAVSRYMNLFFAKVVAFFTAAASTALSLVSGGKGGATVDRSPPATEDMPLIQWPSWPTDAEAAQKREEGAAKGAVGKGEQSEEVQQEEDVDIFEIAQTVGKGAWDLGAEAVRQTKRAAEEAEKALKPVAENAEKAGAKAQEWALPLMGAATLAATADAADLTLAAIAGVAITNAVADLAVADKRKKAIEEGNPYVIAQEAKDKALREASEGGEVRANELPYMASAREGTPPPPRRGRQGR